MSGGADTGKLVVPAGPAGSYGLRAALLVDVDFAPVTLLNVSFSELEIGAQSAFGLRVGDLCTVALAPPGHNAIAAEGRIGDISAWSGGVRLVLRLDNPTSLHASLPRKSQVAFNRREAFRVVPDSRSPIIATFRPGQGSPEFNGNVISLSVTGMGALLAEELADMLSPGDHLSLTFRSPHDAVRLSLVGKVRYKTPYPVGLRVGLAFDPAESSAFATQQKRISRYIMAVQRRLLQVGLDG